jgi:uncharacterized membrane protein YfcA
MEPQPPGLRRRSGLLLLIFLSGLLPLLAGSATFAWWWHTRSEVAERAGIWVVTAGILLVAVGGTALALRLLLGPRPPLRVAVPLIVLIVANPVAAYVYSELIIAAVEAERAGEPAPAAPP